MDNRRGNTTGTVNVFFGVIGAFIGTLLCMVGMILLNYNNYYSGFASSAMYFVAVIGYAWLGGRLDIKGIVVCVLLTLPAVLVGHQVGWTLWYIKNVNDATGITYSFSDFMNLMSNISNRLEILDRMLPLKDSGKLMEDYYKDTFISIVAYLVVMVWVIRECIIILRSKH